MPPALPWETSYFLNTSAAGTVPSTDMPSRSAQEDTLRWTGSPSMAPEASSFLSSTSSGSLPSEGFSLLPKPCGKNSSWGYNSFMQESSQTYAGCPGWQFQILLRRVVWWSLGCMLTCSPLGREYDTVGVQLQSGVGVVEGGGQFPEETSNGQAIQWLGHRC